MDLVFVHGWGFHGGLWHAVRERISDLEHGLVDLGFIRDGPNGIGSWPENAVYVGHSFGLLWLLKHGPKNKRGLISIGGFDRFHEHGDIESLETMKDGLDRSAPAQMRAFWQACGLDKPIEPSSPDPATLKAGLDWLGSWDAREEMAAIDCPFLALASEDDAIVPSTMSKAVWQGKDLRMTPAGGHALPLTEPDWCLAEITRFLDAIDP